LSRRSVLKAFVGTGVGIAAGIGDYGYAYERHAIGVTRAHVPVAGLPPALEGLRIGLITDLHHSRLVPHEDVVAAAVLLSAERPDLIVLGGDYVTWGERAHVQPCAEALATLTAPHGVFGVLGNHDDDRVMPAALAARGAEMLKDQRTRIMIEGEPLEIAGVRFWTRKPEDLARVLRGATGTTILLAHDPRRLASAAELGVHLVLSGHTHGGQVVLPFLGTTIDRRFPVLQGTTRQGDTTLFVSRGVGTVYLPVRWNCPPEVAVLTLQRVDKRA
jgi:predicted MPP superfamily phosphohydrolase